LRLFERLGSAKRLLISYALYAAKEMWIISKSNITVRTLDWLKTFYVLIYSLKYSIVLFQDLNLQLNK
jgi:hypothetical protein